jgi:hypothetical protein
MADVVTTRQSSGRIGPFPLVMGAIAALMFSFLMSIGVLAGTMGHDERQPAYREAQRLLLSETPQQRADMSPATVAQRRQAATDLMIRGFTEEVDLTEEQRLRVAAIRLSGEPIELPVGPMAEADREFYRSINPWLYWWGWLIPIGMFALVAGGLYYSAVRMQRRSTATANDA